MAQTTINYDDFIEHYSNPINIYQPQPKERRSTHTRGILQLIRILCNLSINDVSEKEIIKELAIGLIIGLVTLPLIPFLIILLEILIVN